MKKRIIHVLLAVVLLIGCGMGTLTQSGSQQPAQTEEQQSSEQETGSGEMEFLNDFWKSLFIGKRELVVGRSLDPAKITEFWYTYDAGTNPPVWQRYRFYTENGTRWFYHESRQGDHWPLTEADITGSGTAQLSGEEWEQLCAFMEGGVVRKREDADADGSAGPWLYLYWDGDQSMYQAFTFANAEGLSRFEEFCAALKEK